MKRKVLLFITVLLSLKAFAQKVYDLDIAVENSADEISNILPFKSPTAVVKIFSDSQEMSEYISDSLVSQFAKKNKLIMLERNEKKMALVDAEVDFQYSGSVNDQSMVEIGYKLGAEYLVYGSFDQLGDYLQLSVQAVNVETGEIVYLNSYSINFSSKVTELLGDGKKLISAGDFIDTIARCDKKINSVESDKAREIQKKLLIIENEYNKDIKNVNTLEQEGWESDAEFSARKQKLIDDRTVKYKNDVSAIEKSISTNFDNQIKMIQIQKNKIIEDLKKTTFLLNGDSVQVMVGDFKKNDTPKNWPINIKSLDRIVNYVYNGKYIANAADVKTEFQMVENARKNNTLSGEIVYKIVPEENLNRYSIYISSIRVYDVESGKTLVNEMVEKKVGYADAGTEKKGASAYKKSEKQEKPTEKHAEINIIRTTEKSYSSSTNSENPFENARLFTPQTNEKRKGYVSITSSEIEYEGKTYAALKISGNTGKVIVDYYDYWFEAACYDNTLMNDFIKKGNTIKFKVLGDGKIHRICFITKSGSRFAYDFYTKKDKVTEVEVPYSKMKWLDYSTPCNYRLVKNDITAVYFAAFVQNTSSNKDFSFQIFDVRVY